MYQKDMWLHGHIQLWMEIKVEAPEPAGFLFLSWDHIDVYVRECMFCAGAGLEVWTDQSHFLISW